MKEENRIDFNKEVLSIVNRFGCLTKEQIFAFFPQDSYLLEKVNNCIYYQNSRNKQIWIGENYISRGASPVYDQAMIDCIWALLALLKTSDNPEQTLLFHKYCFEPAYPFSISCVVNHKNICHFTYLDDANNTVPILSAREAVYSKREAKVGKEEKSPANIIFVSRNEEVLDTIAGCELAIPHKILILTGEKFKEPNIDFYSRD